MSKIGEKDIVIDKKIQKKLYKQLYIILTVVAMIIIYVVTRLWMQKALYAMTSIDIIKKITEKDDAVLTIGTIENGEASYVVYGKNGELLNHKAHDYAVGSITKTFTGELIAKLVSEGKINLDEPISTYLNLNEPSFITMKKLITHTSGLGIEWEEALLGDEKVSFSREDIIKTLNKAKLEDKEYSANYSNFGTGLAGTIAAEVLGGSYQSVMNSFIKEELGLENTKVGGFGDLSNYWSWNPDDEMQASGAIISNIDDMLKYAQIQLDGDKEYVKMSHMPLEQFDDCHKCGYFWIINDDGIVWHNGEVELAKRKKGYQAFIGFSKEKNKAVVILSNQIKNDMFDVAYTDRLGLKMLQDENVDENNENSENE